MKIGMPSITALSSPGQNLALWRELVQVMLAGILTLLLLGQGYAALEDMFKHIPIAYDDVRNDGILDFVIDAQGTPWIIVNWSDPAIRYWTGETWQKVESTHFQGMRSAKFHDFGVHGLYLIASKLKLNNAPSPTEGALCKLLKVNKDFVEPIVEFKYYVFTSAIKVNIDSKGRFWHWDALAVRKYEGGQWERYDADLNYKYQTNRIPTMVERKEGDIYFLGVKKYASYAENKLSVHQYPEQNAAIRDTIRPVQLGNDRVVFYKDRTYEAAIFNLVTKKFEKGLDKALRSSSCPISGVVRDNDGNVIIIGRTLDNKNMLVHVKADQDEVGFRPEHISGNHVLKTGNIQKHPNSVLCLPNGEIILGSTPSAFVKLAQGKAEKFGFENGFLINDIQWIYSRSDSEIWVASSKMGIVAYKPAGTRNIVDATLADKYDLLQLNSKAAIKDFEGNTWCFLWNRPGEISRWDGKGWDHIETGDSTSRINFMFADNLGRIHYEIASRRKRYLTLDPDNVSTVSHLNELIENAVASGAREFLASMSSPISAPMVINEEEIYYCDRNSGFIHYFDGEVWSKITYGSGIADVFKSPGDELRVRTRDCKLFSQERGKTKNLESERNFEDTFLLGKEGLIPFVKDVYAQRKEPLLIVSGKMGTFTGVSYIEDLESVRRSSRPKSTFDLGSKLLNSITDQGFIFLISARRDIIRFAHDTLFEIGAADVMIRDVVVGQKEGAFEDRSGNLIVHSPATLLIVKREDVDVKIIGPGNIAPESRRIRVEFPGTIDGEPSDELKYMWRVDDAKWSEPSDECYVEFFIDEVGTYDFSVFAFSPRGFYDPSPANLTINLVAPPRDAETNLVTPILERKE